MPVTATTLLIWVAHAVVGFLGGLALGMWRGMCKGKADQVYEVLGNHNALRSFLKGEVARRGGLDGLAKGVKRDTLFGSVLDEKFSRLETLRVSSMVAEYAFYAVLAGAALISGAYLALIGIPVCYLMVKQTAKDKGEPQGTEVILELFGLFHAWLKHNPVEAFSYAKNHQLPVQNLTNVLRETGAYAL